MYTCNTRFLGGRPPMNALYINSITIPHRSPTTLHVAMHTNAIMDVPNNCSEIANYHSGVLQILPSIIKHESSPCALSSIERYQFLFSRLPFLTRCNIIRWHDCSVLGAQGRALPPIVVVLNSLVCVIEPSWLWWKKYNHDPNYSTPPLRRLVGTLPI